MARARRWVAMIRPFFHHLTSDFRPMSAGADCVRQLLAELRARLAGRLKIEETGRKCEDFIVTGTKFAHGGISSHLRQT